MMHLARRVALLLVLAASLPVAAGAQGGLLKRARQKATEKIAEKATSKATQRGRDTAAVARADSGGATVPGAPARGGGMSTRREKPLDPTVLESPGRRENAGSPAGGQAPSWHGSAIPLETFRSTIAEITPARLTRYMRARQAVVDEAAAIQAMYDAGDAAGVRRLMGTPLAEDERPPLPGYMKIWPMAGPRRVERHLDALLERELGGELTRMQFYQMHEMVEMFLNGEVNRHVAQSGAVGRKLTPAELALLEQHRASLMQMRQKAKQL